MALARRKPKTIDGYLAGVNADQRVALEKLRKTIRAAAPGVEECISFQISKGTIRFSPDNPLPLALVKKLVKARIAQDRI